MTDKPIKTSFLMISHSWMGNKLISGLFLSFLLLGSVLKLNAQEIPPKPGKLVNDYTNSLTPDQVNRLEQKLVAFDDSTSTQIAVVIIRSTGSYEIAEYAVKLAQSWGVGHAGKNNGIVLLAALADKKVTIQTGYGVEGALPDAIASRIIRNRIVPSFKIEDYYGGLDQATNDIIAYTKGEYKNEDPPKKTGRKHSRFPAGLVIPIVLIAIVIISRKGGGGGGKIIGGRGSASPFWWFLMGSALGRGSGNSGGWGGGGGSSGGGGFGGFGGGSFGGGGASGSW